MKCNFKVMLSVGLAMVFGAGLAYLAFEEARTAILASLPVMAVLLCPISMLIMMKHMHSSGQAQAGESKPEQAVVPIASESNRRSRELA